MAISLYFLRCQWMHQTHLLPCFLWDFHVCWLCLLFLVAINRFFPPFQRRERLGLWLYASCPKPNELQSEFLSHLNGDYLIILPSIPYFSSKKNMKSCISTMFRWFTSIHRTFSSEIIGDSHDFPFSLTAQASISCWTKSWNKGTDISTCRATKMNNRCIYLYL